MSAPAPGAITAQLIELGQGTPEALARLAPLVYDQLHRLATGQMRSERIAHTLQPTALVHEAFLRLQAGIPPDVRSRAQFYALAARIMRGILVDHARARGTEKRGGGGGGSPSRNPALSRHHPPLWKSSPSSISTSRCKPWKPAILTWPVSWKCGFSRA